MVELDYKSTISTSLEVPILNKDSVFEENLGKKNPTITIDILVKNGVMEHIHIIQTCSLDEIDSYATLFK